MLASRHSPLLKRARALLTRRGREREGAFLVEGARAVADVVAAGAQVEVVLLVADAGHEALGAALTAKGVPVVEVSGEAFSAVSDTNTPAGVMAVVSWREPGPERLDPAPKRLLVLDAVRDPGNLGTLLRCADAVQAGVVLTPGCADPLSPKVVRASAASVARTLWVRMDVRSLQRWLAARSYGIVVLAAGARSVYDGALPSPLAVVAGNEAHGPEADWPGGDRRAVPMREGVDSLNVAVAAAVVLYEDVRQHGLD